MRAVFPTLTGPLRSVFSSGFGAGGAAASPVPTDLTVQRTGTALVLQSSTGVDAILPAADQALAGILAAADKAKLDTLTAGGEAIAAPLYASLLAVGGATPTGDYLRTAGHTTPGKGGALYIRAQAEPAHDLKVQSADGAWWEIAEPRVTPQMAGAPADGLNSDVAALNRLIAYANGRGAPETETEGTEIHLPAGRYFVETALEPITANHVSITGARGAAVFAADGALFTLGTASIYARNLTLSGFAVLYDRAVTPGADATVAKVVNGSELRLRDLFLWRAPQLLLVQAAAGRVTSNILVSDITGASLDRGRALIEIDNAAGTGSGLYLSRIRLFPTDLAGVSVDWPVEQRRSISAATQADPVALTFDGDHGYATGDTILIREATGMTALNDRSFTVTVTGPTTLTLDGEDGTAFGAYLGGGHAVQRHPVGAGTDFLKIVGQWDTAIVTDILVNRYYRGVYLLADRQGLAVSNLYFSDCVFDYCRASAAVLNAASGRIGRFLMRQSWLNATDGTAIQMTAPGGFVEGAEISDCTVLMAGLHGVVIPAASTGVKLRGLRVYGCGRYALGSQTVYGILREAGAEDVTIDDVVFADGAQVYGTAGVWLPDTAIAFANANVGYRLTNCLTRAKTTHYSVPVPTAGGGLRQISGNRRADGALPEFVYVTTIPVGASPYTVTNQSGLQLEVFMRGGTVTQVEIDGAAVGADRRQVVVNPGGTYTVHHVETPVIVHHFRQ